jgi:hypothetical protein
MNEQSSIIQLVELGLIFLVGFVILSGLGVYAMRQMQSRRPRSVSYPDRPALHFQGRGESTVSTNGLIESSYRIDYCFPGDVLVKIELIERATGNDEVILIKSGEGVEGFTVPHAGDYLLRIEPLADDAAWSFDIRPVGPRPAG